jgi:hypothetical protein
MGRKFVTVYTFLSIIILIGILGFTFFRIRTLRDDRLQTARYSFARIRGSVEGALAAEKSFKSPAFRSAIDSSFLTLPPLQLMVIYSYDKGIYYLKARNSEVLSTPPSELDSIKGLPQFNYNTFTQCKITSSLAVPPDTTYLLDALFLLFNPLNWSDFSGFDTYLIIFSGITAVVTYRETAGTFHHRSCLFNTLDDNPRTCSPSRYCNKCRPEWLQRCF